MPRSLLRSAPLFIGLLLAACAPADDAQRTADLPRAEGGGAASEPAPAPTSPACPAATFEEFFSLFASDSATQRAWTDFPLPQSRVEPTANGFESVEDTLALAAARFPLLPSPEQRADEGREVRLESLPDGQWKAIVFLPESDWIVEYTFTAVSGCWWLSRIDDSSL